jgi:hypothetical protein
MNVVNITLKESDYNLIMGHFSLLDIVPISTKILPDDSEIRDNAVYKDAINRRRKAQKEEDTIRFLLTTNK